MNQKMHTLTLRKKWPYSEFFWSECGKMWARKTPNTDTFHVVSTTFKATKSLNIHQINIYHS